MTTLDTSSAISAPPFREAELGALFDLELLVARRADELAGEQRGATHEVDRELWHRAEVEVFAQIDRNPMC